METPGIGQLRSSRDYYAQYHNHKELMAYGATVLYVTGAASLVLSSGQERAAASSLPALLAIALTAVIGLLFVAWQFRNRRIAALVVEACTKLLTRSLSADEVKKWQTDPLVYCGQTLPHFLVDEMVAVGESRRGFRNPLVPEGLTYVIMGTWAILAVWTLAH